MAFRFHRLNRVQSSSIIIKIIENPPRFFDFDCWMKEKYYGAVASCCCIRIPRSYSWGHWHQWEHFSKKNCAILCRMCETSCTATGFFRQQQEANSICISGAKNIRRSSPRWSSLVGRRSWSREVFGISCFLIQGALMAQFAPHCLGCLPQSFPWCFRHVEGQEENGEQAHDGVENEGAGQAYHLRTKVLSDSWVIEWFTFLLP